jgi:hypothetical protein
MRKGYLLPKIHIMLSKAKCRQLFTALDAGIVPLYNTAIKIRRASL